jgi:hypothetical protein
VTAIGTGAWHHVAVTCNQWTDTLKLFVDGRLDKTYGNNGALYDLLEQRRHT